MTSPYRSASGRYIEWRRLLRVARSKPGVFQLLLPDEPITLAKTIRLRRHPDLAAEPGILITDVRNQYDPGNGRRRADIYVRWSPRE